MRRVLGWFLVLVFGAAPIVAACSVVGRARLMVEPPAMQVWVPVARAVDASLPSVVIPQWERQQSVVAPAWSGLVQEVLVAPEQRVVTGTPVAVVDGITRIAASTQVPISKALQRGDSGQNVAALNALLMSLELPVSPDDTFGASTAAGVTELAESLGAGETEVFDPTWIVFLSSENALVASVALAVAQPVPAAGAEVFSLRPRLIAARVVPRSAVSDNDNGRSGPEATSLPGEPQTPPVIDPALYFNDLAPETVVAVGDTEIRGLSPDGVLEAGALADLESVVEPGESTVPAMARVPLPAGAARVPTSTVIIGPTAASCVLSRALGGGPDDVVSVEVIDSYLGVSTVVGVDMDSEVLVDPSAEDRLSCR